jgi:hypothetical protein
MIVIQREKVMGQSDHIPDQTKIVAPMVLAMLP